MEYATHEFKLSKTGKDGVSLRAHLHQVEKTTGVTPPGLENPAEFPEALGHVWEWFAALSNARPPGMYGLAPISFHDIEAWSRLTNNRPTPTEVELIRRLDDAFRREVQGSIK